MILRSHQASCESSCHLFDDEKGVTVEKLGEIVNEVLTPRWGDCKDDRNAKDPKNRILRVNVGSERR